MANVAMTSATTVTGQQRGRHGQRPGKPMAGKSGDDLAVYAYFNMRSVASMIASICTKKARRKKKPKLSAWTVSRFVSQAIHLIHAGLNPGLKATRNHETAGGYGCPRADVKERWTEFMNELQGKIDVGDPRELCAWVEYHVRFDIHPFADGTGRLSTALCAWIMLRRQQAIPSYAFWQRSSMHEKLREGFPAFRDYYMKACFEEAQEATVSTHPPRAAARVQVAAA